MIYTLYKTQDIVEILEGKFMGNDSQKPIKYLLIDSRKILHPIASIYFALTGERHDGHDYIAELYDKGVRNFVISIEAKNTESFPEANFIKVKDTTEALQKLAAVHRQKVEIPVIAITG
ncbi:MAG TPA: bifunctional UDP-N-acetylmuramoyl-tripeptide:D-alanyl-D-alanine ligase/alanine racemase, partial [Flavobacteriales bacterium]|nr:bifunctional UDP-N-acetylmuramoyl-tripeptide:D-alanyl-D-alanine ligase/alanine racemase [Flavobacteriales bacterium]